MKEHVWIAGRNKRLSAMLHIPARFEAQTPLIIFCHGFTGDKVGYNQLNVNLAKVLEANGYGVLRFDYRGSGDSDGDFATDTCVAGWKEDLNSALRWITGQARLTGHPLVLYGHSLGGLVVLTHRDEQGQIAARMVFAPVTKPVDNFQKVILGPDLWQKSLGGEQIGYFYGKGFKLDSQFVRDLSASDYHPAREMAAVDTPLFIAHGSRDTVVPIADSKAFYHSYRGPKEFRELDVAHSAENNQEALQQAVLQWLHRNFPVTERTTSD